MRLLERLRVPRILSALLLISLLISVVIGFGTALMGPATTWAAKLPLGVPRLQEHLSFLHGPVAAVQHFLQQAESYVSGDVPATATPTPAPPASSGVRMTLFTGTRAIVAGLFETVLVFFFCCLRVTSSFVVLSRSYLASATSGRLWISRSKSSKISRSIWSQSP
jgi:predicted PurR-regulated permease PerM